MPPRIIQMDYEQGERIAEEFSHKSAELQQLIQTVQRCVQALEAGDWEGLGAHNFFSEMKQLIFPALRRLDEALRQGNRSMKQIARHFQQAEDDAGALFRGADGRALPLGVGGGIAAKTDSTTAKTLVSSGGTNMRVAAFDGGGGGGSGGGSGGFGGGSNLPNQTLDTPSGDSALNLVRDIRAAANAMKGDIEGRFNLELKARYALYAVLNLIGIDPSSLLGTMKDMTVGGGTFIYKLLTGAGVGTAFVVGFAAQIWVNLFVTVADSIIGTSWENPLEKTWRQGQEDAVKDLQGFISRNKDLIETQVSMDGVATAMEGYISTLPDGTTPSFSGQIVNQGGQLYAIIYGNDGRPISANPIPVTQAAANQLDGMFDQYGPNFTTMNSTSGAVRDYLSSHWQGLSTGASPSAAIDAAINALRPRIDAGESLTLDQIITVAKTYETFAVPEANPTPSGGGNGGYAPTATPGAPTSGGSGTPPSGGGQPPLQPTMPTGPAYPPNS